MGDGQFVVGIPPEIVDARRAVSRFLAHNHLALRQQKLTATAEGDPMVPYPH